MYGKELSFSVLKFTTSGLRNLTFVQVGLAEHASDKEDRRRSAYYCARDYNACLSEIRQDSPAASTSSFVTR